MTIKGYCQDCEYCEKVDWADTGYRCRRFPPQWTGGHHTHTNAPEVCFDSYCGEFLERQEATLDT